MTELAQLTLTAAETRLLLAFISRGAASGPALALVTISPEAYATLRAKLVGLAEWWQDVTAQGHPRG